MFPLVNDEWELNLGQNPSILLLVSKDVCRAYRYKHATCYSFTWLKSNYCQNRAGVEI